PFLAIIFSGLLFGLMHGNLNQFTYTVVLGMILCLINEATGSMLSSMLFHFILNASNVINVYLLPWLYSLMQNTLAASKESYEALGMPELYTQLEEMATTYFGDMSLTASEWMTQLFATSSQVSFSLGEVIASFGLRAVIYTFFAYIVWKWLARKNGRWDHIVEIFNGRKENKTTLFTIPLTIAIALFAVYIFLYEVALRYSGIL
ncbi:MAG: CPBP family intramembrane metalloprotease, partial [Lachnospiraceae bacterium]|nr:CPBP family intramembrane metalloprotease [Lachnospiraceae bacterium]